MRVSITGCEEKGMVDMMLMIQSDMRLRGQSVRMVQVAVLARETLDETAG